MKYKFIGFDYFGIVVKENEKSYCLPACDVISWYFGKYRGVSHVRTPEDNFMIEYCEKGSKRLEPTQEEINAICQKYRYNLYETPDA